jgi:hypothetical protein
MTWPLNHCGCSVNTTSVSATGSHLDLGEPGRETWTAKRLRPKRDRVSPLIFLLAPLLFVFLGSAYIDRGRRMLDVATYVNTWLRRQVSESLGVEMWLWETFKKAHYDKSNRVARSIAMAFDGLRGMIFVLCGVISLGVYVALPTKLSGFGRVTLFALDVTLLLTLTLFIWLFEETRGLPDRVVGATASASNASESSYLGDAIRRHVHGRYPTADELPSPHGLPVSRDERRDGQAQDI